MEDEVDWLTGQCIEWRSETCEVAVAKRVRMFGIASQVG